MITRTDEVVSGIHRYAGDPGLSNIWATRGGAFRDIDRPSDALACGRKSIAANPDTWHGYNLTGAACYDLRKFKDGDRYFEIAKERGANALWIEQFKVKTRAAHAAEQKEIVRGLWEESDYSGPFDLDALREAELLRDEIDDLNESFHRSEEDGWYYDDKA